jgi:hypothetical protein
MTSLKEFADFALAILDGESQEAARALKQMDARAGERREIREAKAAWRRDYLDNPIPPHMNELYQECPSCRKYVWHSSSVLGMCPLCIIELPTFELEISFAHSRSKKYRTALKRAREISAYMKEEERHIIRFGSLGEFSDQRGAVNGLMLVIFRWRSTTITLNGGFITADGVNTIAYEINRMRDRAGASEITFSGNIPIYTPVNIF